MRIGPITTFYIDKQVTQLTKNNTNKHNQPPRKKKRKRIRKNKDITIAAINVRGAKGKIKSLESLLTTEKIHIALITETLFKEKEGYNIKGYKWIGNNRSNKKGGGIGILISSQIAGCTSEANNIEENENLETKWIKLETRPKPIHIGVYYGPQENNTKEKNEQIYQALETQIKQLQTQGEIILGGDFNAKLEIKSKKGDQKQSRNGLLLQNLIEETNLTPITTNADHGHWTRVNRCNTNEKSIIDYILTTKEISKYKGITTIDEEGQLRIKGKNETDHNTIVTNFKINNQRKPEYIERWKKGTKETWEEYNRKFQRKHHEGALRTENYEEMEKTIIETLESTVGKTRTRIDKPKKTKNNETKLQNRRRKEAKQNSKKHAKHKAQRKRSGQ